MANLWDALTKGEGTPWGPTQMGKPELPSTDLNAYQGMDTSPMLKAGKARIGNAAAKGREQALAQLRKAGVRGADTGAAIAGVAGNQLDALGNLEANLAGMDQQARADAQRRAMEQYAAQMMGYAGEQQGRSGFWNSLMGAAGSGLGSYFGGKAAAGGK
jgi:hypothetical protein